MSSKEVAKEPKICQPTVLRIAEANNLQWLGRKLGWSQKTEIKTIKDLTKQKLL